MRWSVADGAAGMLAAVGPDELRAACRGSRWESGSARRRSRARVSPGSRRRATARLDEANARGVGALFAELAATTGTAIVCATHDPVLIEHARAEVPLATLAA
jgi:hypothetical protein